MKTQIKRLEELEQLKEGAGSFICAERDPEGVYTVEGKQYSKEEFEERFLRNNNCVRIIVEGEYERTEFNESQVRCIICLPAKVPISLPDNGREK